MPRRIINRFVVSFNGEVAITVNLEPAVSADPLHPIRDWPSRTSGLLDFQWFDDDGSVYSLQQAGRGRLRPPWGAGPPDSRHGPYLRAARRGAPSACSRPPAHGGRMPRAARRSSANASAAIRSAAARNTASAHTSMTSSTARPARSRTFATPRRCWTPGPAAWSGARTTLDAFLSDPPALVPRSRMSFGGMEGAEDRADARGLAASAFRAPTTDQSAGGADRDPRGIRPRPRRSLPSEGDPEYGAYLAGECTTCHQDGRQPPKASRR